MDGEFLLHFFTPHEESETAVVALYVFHLYYIVYYVPCILKLTQ